jgi:D-sedoheptulose 7-phosphate isomerase
MKKSSIRIIDTLVDKYPVLDLNKQIITTAINDLVFTFKSKNKLLICGNGGSAADSLHIAGELMKSFAISRPLNSEVRNFITGKSIHAKYYFENLQMPLPTIPLIGSSAFETAFSNDSKSDLIFAQQVLAFGLKNDVLMAISTSGNSLNVLYAVDLAKLLGLRTICLTGKSGGKIKDCCDLLINVNVVETYKIQELHLPIYHCICMAVENEIFGI